MTADGANPQPLAPSITVHDTPSWSPDDKAIAIAGVDQSGPGIFVVPLDGGSPVRVYDKICYLPAWSPDNQYILIGEYVVGAQMQLKALTLNGQSIKLPDIRFSRTATTGFSTPYRFLPDGMSIVLLEQELRKPQFWLVDLATGARRQLTDFRAARWTRSFDVARDGKSILFDRVQENSDIVLIELAR